MDTFVFVVGETSLLQVQCAQCKRVLKPVYCRYSATVYCRYRATCSRLPCLGAIPRSMYTVLTRNYTAVARSSTPKITRRLNPNSWTWRTLALRAQTWPPVSRQMSVWLPWQPSAVLGSSLLVVSCSTRLGPMASLLLFARSQLRQAVFRIRSSGRKIAELSLLQSRARLAL